MNDFIGNHIKFIADWGQFIMITVVIISCYLLYLIGRKNKYFLPKGFFGYLGGIILFLLILVSSLIFARITVIKPGIMAIIEDLESVKGSKAPPLAFQQLEDSTTIHYIEDYEGKVVLVNFWATWCAPCLKEMPDLSKLHEDYKDRGGIVIAISDESRERLLRFVEGKPLKMIVGYTQSFDWVDLGSERPATFLIDKNGIVQEYFTGPYGYEFFESKILEYIKE